RGLRGGGFAHVTAQLAERVGLDLPDTLGRYAILVGQLVKRSLLIGHPALLQDVAAPVVQTRERALQPVRRVSLPLRVFHAFGRIGIGSGQIGGRAVAFLFTRLRGRVE